MKSNELDVFINCPFDSEYKPLFEAILFTIAATGFRARCALEEDDSGDIRLDKLCRLIGESPFSVHDLSRTVLNQDGLPRFNMPFELGLVIGAKRFGTKRFAAKSALVMVSQPYKLPAYLSDFGGNDPHAHRGKVDEVIRIVRQYLGTGIKDIPFPGPRRLLHGFNEFKVALPRLAADYNLTPEEIDPLQGYRDYAFFLSAYLKNFPIV